MVTEHDAGTCLERSRNDERRAEGPCRARAVIRAVGEYGKLLSRTVDLGSVARTGFSRGHRSETSVQIFHVAYYGIPSGCGKDVSGRYAANRAPCGHGHAVSGGDGNAGNHRQAGIRYRVHGHKRYGYDKILTFFTGQSTRNPPEWAGFLLFRHLRERNHDRSRVTFPFRDGLVGREDERGSEDFLPPTTGFRNGREISDLRGFQRYFG